MSKPNTRAIIDANIRQNSQHLITGQVLNATLNAMVTDYAEQAALDGLKEKVDSLALGAFYGYFPDSNSLPTDVTTPGYAYVGSDNPYKIWNFNGESWSDSGTSIDMNDADEEDITRNADGKLQFKDRSYGDGMGYVILRKDKTFAEQVTQANTIYEIRYDFDLHGEEVSIPNNCLINFMGGKLSNGTLRGLSMNNPSYAVFDNIVIDGINAQSVDIRWFGAISDLQYSSSSNTFSGTDCSDALKKALLCANRNMVNVDVIGNFYLGQKVSIDGSLRIRGNYGITFDNVNTSKALPNLFVNPSLSCAIEVNTNGDIYNKTISIENLNVGSTGNTANFLNYFVDGAPCRPGFIHKSRFTGLNIVFNMRVLSTASSWSTYQDLDIANCYAAQNNVFLYTDTEKTAAAKDRVNSNVGNIVIRSCTIENNIQGCLHIYYPNGSVDLFDNTFEGQPNAIDIVSAFSVSIHNNYFELNGGDYCARVRGFIHFTWHYAAAIRIFDNVNASVSGTSPVIVVGVVLNPYIQNNSNLVVKMHPQVLMRESKRGIIKASDALSIGSYAFRPMGLATKCHVDGCSCISSNASGTLRRIAQNDGDRHSLSIGDSFIAMYRIMFLDGYDEESSVYNLASIFANGGNPLYRTDPLSPTSITSNYEASLYKNFLPNVWYDVIMRYEDIKFAVSYFELYSTRKCIVSVPVFIYGTTETLRGLNLDDVAYPMTYEMGGSSDFPVFAAYGQEYTDVSTGGKYIYDNGWKLKQGLTSDRPTSVSEGFAYYDTTISKPIYWTGTKWVDATGADV